MAEPSYKSLLIKVSGESLKGDSSVSIDERAVFGLIRHVKDAQAKGVKVSLVVGGGNIWRGRESAIASLSRPDADMMGMLATVMNGIALRSAYESASIPCVMFSALSISGLCDDYHPQKALDALNEGKVVLFVAGTGSPFFTTDTAATLRALEMNCDLLLKLTKVDGIYDKDPLKHKDAKRFETLTFQEVLKNRYAVMDAAAVTLAEEGNLPVFVGSFFEEGIITQVLSGAGAVTRMIKGE